VPKDEWSADTADAIGRRVGHYREALGLSVQQLSDKIKDEYGVVLQRPVLSNLENGRRHAISATEVLILARVLDVPPTLLLFPIGKEEEIEVLPGHITSSWEAAKWFGGEMPLPPDERKSSQMSADEWNDWAADWNKWAENAQPVWTYRTHEIHVERQLATRRRALELRKNAVQTEDEVTRDALREQARDLDVQYWERHEYLKEVRQEMRKRDITPPELPAELLNDFADERTS
jgi:transcriptional regulator with XRE-family HTH domain